ncbi:MAG TPA: hypothetical protein VMI54_20260 [Polyangiaceae bacterium]|nr:hypothetical protein [Polyangiaceae bacterium]
MRVLPNLALALVLFGSAAAAEPARLTEFERQTLADSAAKLHLSPALDRNPEGKRIERVDIVVLDVFDEHDPVPDFVDVFHTTTRKVVIENELLFHEGERYYGARVEESARNLRQLDQELSLVMIVPLAGSTPDRVRVLVIVKDVWSLRLDNNISLAGNGIQNLELTPSETNLAGFHTTVFADFTLRPDTYSFGGGALQNRILGTGLYAQGQYNVVYGRSSGAVEGSRGQFIFGDPLRNATQRWAFGTGIYWDDEMARHLLTNGRTAPYDAPSTPENDAIPNEYRSRRYIGGYQAIRSFGLVEKYDLYFGVEVDRRNNVHTPIAGENPAAERDFLNAWVPVSDTRASPFVQLRTHVEHYLRTSYMETLALEEDFRLGPETLLRVYPASSKLGSSRDLLGIIAGASMTWRLGDGLVRVVGQNRTEYEFEGRHDADALAQARVATPRVGFGRFHFDAFVRDRYENYLNRYFELGGDSRLRGYPSLGYADAFKGTLAVALNAEFRTRSLDILSVRTGLVAFYDAGDATDRLRDVRLHQSTGLGLRFLIPELDRLVLRFDWAFPLNPLPGYRTLPGTPFIAFEQAIPFPALSTPNVMTPTLN